MISASTSRAMLFTMQRIRRLQDRINAEYLNNTMPTPVHLCTGQEAVATGVCQALRRNDVISSNHRGHGHYLAKGGDMMALVAELHGRATGCSGGFGGSMHLVDTTAGHLGSSSIVGGGIPIGTGHALAFQLRGSKQVSAVFLGDGASEEGVFYESVHFAVLKRLPVIYVLEDNGWAVCSPKVQRQATRHPLLQGFPQGKLYTVTLDGNDVHAVYEATVKAVRRARRGSGPSFLLCRTYRIAPHAGCEVQDPIGYRTPEEVEIWRRRCPVARFTAQLMRRTIIDAAWIASSEVRIARELDNCFVAALAAPAPVPATLGNHLFV